MEELLALSELRAILRVSLKATSWTNVAQFDYSLRVADGEPDLEHSPGFRRLVEQILFSRRFVITYYLVILGIFTIFTVAHLYEKHMRWRRHTKPVQSDAAVNGSASLTASSSSSTLHGVPPPPTNEDESMKVDERTELLGDHGESIEPSPATDGTFLPQLSRRFQSYLMYQPGPLPALTSPTNNLPSNGTSLLILLFLGINILYLFYHTPISIPMLFALADRAGLCFVVNLPVLYILAAKTNQPIKTLTGWSYEGLNIFHRRLGEWMTILAIVHTVGMFGVWYTLLRPLHFSFLRFLSTKLVLLGIFTFIAYVVIYITSTGYFRHLYYETFLGLHIVLQVSALIFLFFHHKNSRPYVFACFAIWAFDRLVSRLAISTKSFCATLQIAEDGETVLLFCDIPIRRFMSTLELDMKTGWLPGQHVFVTIPGISWKHRVQAHPFSIASPAPPADQIQGSWPLELIIRAKDGFSRELLTYAKFHQHTQIFLDGPYGSTDALEALRHADRKCLIAGGSGIAVTYSLSWDLLVRNTSEAIVSTRTIYENGSKHTATIKSQATTSGHEVIAHFWIRRSSAHQRWITTVPKLTGLINEAGNRSGETDGSVLVGSVITESFSTKDEGDEATPTSSRPDVGWMLRNWVESSTEQRNLANGRSRRICVVVSGPDGLVRDVRNTAAVMVRSGWNIEVFVEKFGW